MNNKHPKYIVRVRIETEVAYNCITGEIKMKDETLTHIKSGEEMKSVALIENLSDCKR